MTDKETPEPLGAPEGPVPPVAPEPPAAPGEPTWEDKDGDGILSGDEIDLNDPFDAIDGDEDTTA